MLDIPHLLVPPVVFWEALQTWAREALRTGLTIARLLASSTSPPKLQDKLLRECLQLIHKAQAIMQAEWLLI